MREGFLVRSHAYIMLFSVCVELNKMYRDMLVNPLFPISLEFLTLECNTPIPSECFLHLRKKHVSLDCNVFNLMGWALFCGAFQSVFLT